MDLKQLKTMWEDTNIHEKPVSARNIHIMIKKKSKTTLAQIKSTMRVKMWVAGVSMVIALALSAGQLFRWFSEPLFFSGILSLTEAGIIFLVMGLVIATVMAGNIWYYLRIKRFEQTSHNLRKQLQQTTHILTHIMRLEVYSDVVFVPLISGFIGFRWLYGTESFTIDIQFGYLILLMAATSYGAYLLANRLMKKKYGRELEQLQSYLRELEPQ